MKVAFVTVRPPYPLNTGGRIRTFHLLRQISQVHEVTLVTAVEGPEDEAALAGLRDSLPPIAIRRVTVPPRTAPLRRAARMALALMDPLPYTWAAYGDRRFRANLQAALTASDYDLLHCDHVHVAHALRGLPTPPRLLNAHNIESVLLRRTAEHESSRWKKALITWQYAKTLRAEGRAHRHFDRSVVVSEVDRAALERLSPGLSISVVPNGVDICWFETGGGPSEPHTMVFVGAMDWLPNVDGVKFFLREVLPRIRRRVPRAEVWVVGRNPQGSLLRPSAGDGVRVTGTVDDVRPYLARASLVVVPLRIGGGTRLKILEAWAMGKAVLSTAVGAEGLPAFDGENIALADTPEDMAARAVALLIDAKGAARLGAGGRRVVEEHFSWKRVADRLLGAYDETVQRARHRAGTPRGHGRIVGLADGSRVRQCGGRQ